MQCLPLMHNQKKKKKFEKVLQIVVLVIKNMFSFFNDYNGQLD